jgi:hypothetical protein
MTDQQMNDKEMDAVLRTWMQEAPVEQPDRSRVVGHVVGRLGSTQRRRRRWWPFSVFRRGTTTPATPLTPERQPIPATNGHTHTVTGRTQSMFSPAKAITSGALVFALGGVLLIAQPFDEQGGSVPGAETDTERAAPVPVTGESRDGPCVGPMPSEIIDGVRHERSGLCSQTVSFSDPRLEGEATYQFATTDHLDENGVAIVTLGTDALSIVNDNGAWMQPPALWASDLGSSGDARLLVLYGEGGYEGLVAVLTETGCSLCTFEGFIIDGDFPPPTETASTK